jgi:hypothetical protein
MRPLIVMALATLVLSGCSSDTPEPTPTLFDRPAGGADRIPGGPILDITDARLAGAVDNATVYLGLRHGSRVVCMVVVANADVTDRTGACVDRPPLEFLAPGFGSFRYDTGKPSDGWAAIGPDVYADNQ